MHKQGNRVVNYLVLVLNYISKVFSVLLNEKVRRYSLYDNQSNIKLINEQLATSDIVDIKSIKGVYFIGLSTYTEKTMKLLNEVCINESYYRLNFLDWYLEMGIDKDGNEDFIGDVINVFYIQTYLSRDYLLVIKKDYSKGRAEYKEHTVLLKPVKNFMVGTVDFSRKVCDALPASKIFDHTPKLARNLVPC